MQKTASVDFRKMTATGQKRGAAKLEWLSVVGNRPVASDALWLVDWKVLKSDRYCVYVISPENALPAKVGISACPRKRLGDLQVANWKRLRVSHCWWTESKKDALAIERLVHESYKQQNKWMLGEWIDARASEASEQIEWVCALNNIFCSKDVPAEVLSFVQKEIDRLWPYEAQYHAHAKAHDNFMNSLVDGVEKS